jgi:hypothetical protein
MEPPKDINLPFFAYGLFRPGQLAYFQLHEFVRKMIESASVPGSLLLRDGLPILDPKGFGHIEGALLTFLPNQAAEAYGRISSMEPDKHYLWLETQAGDKLVNVLAGRSPSKGSVPLDKKPWNGWKDPLFTDALYVVKETFLKSRDEDLRFNPQDNDWDLKPLFRLQMAYLLLWSSIERYVSLRYHLGDKVKEKVDKLAEEPAFARGLQLFVKGRREVYRADRPRDKEVLDPTSPKKSINYYYQVRSNITHRGKGVFRDYELLKDSLGELLPIFHRVLEAARQDASIPDNRFQRMD